MKLSIENYNLLNFNNDSIIISPKGVSRVTSPSLLDVLKNYKIEQAFQKLIYLAY